MPLTRPAAPWPFITISCPPDGACARRLRGVSGTGRGGLGWAGAGGPGADAAHRPGRLLPRHPLPPTAQLWCVLGATGKALRALEWTGGYWCLLGWALGATGMGGEGIGMDWMGHWCVEHWGRWNEWGGR